MPYIGKSPSFGVRNRFVYVASSGATSVSGADANGATLTFTDGAFVDVYLNGVLLKPTTDYNTTTANTISGLSALNTSDEVTVVVYDVFAVADTVSATSGGTFSGNVTFNGDISVGDDVSLASDSAVLKFGADSEVTLTHVHNTGLSLNDNLTITTADNDPQLTLTSTDTDASNGPRINMHRDSSSPADDDVIGLISFQGENDASEVLDLAFMFAQNADVTDGTEDGRLIFQTYSNGAALQRINIQPTETVFNEGSEDLDFRVESNGDANCLFVDGGNDEVGIGTNTPSSHSSSNGAKLVVNTSGATFFQLNGGSSSSCGIEFTDDAAQGQIHYFHGNNSLTFTVAGTQHFSIASNGDLTATDTSISSISDERLKKDINDYSYDLETFKKFKPKTFNWKNPAQHGDKSGVRGFLAQDILAVDNYLVSQTDIEPNTAVSNLDAEADLIPKDSDGKRLSYTSKLDGNDAMYISVIQQLITRIEALESK
jgi:hypothetical protein